MTAINTCIQGDCRDVMRGLIAEGVRVQCIVTSPPYWGLRDYGVDGQLGLEPTLPEFIAHMVEVFDLCRQLLADDGTLWMNMGDSYASKPNGPAMGASTLQGSLAPHAQTRAANAKRSRGVPAGLKHKDLVGQPWRLAFALQDAGWFLRQDIIWHKPNPMPESIKDRCTKAHEYLFLMSKSARYYYDQKAIRTPASSETKLKSFETMNFNARDTYAAPAGWDTSAGPHGSVHRDGRRPASENFKRTASKRAEAHPGQSAGTHRPDRPDSEYDLTTANRRSVWTIATEAYPGAHFATFPEALVEPCVLAGSRPGDIVFDPFMGSGTVAAVAQRLGRRWLGAELNPDYLPLQAARTRQGGLTLETAA
jgi:DNA modification methylase